MFLRAPQASIPHDVEVVVGRDLAPVEVQDLFPDGLRHAARAGDGQGHRFAEGDVHVEEGPPHGDDLELVLDVVEIAMDHLGGRDQLLRLLVGHESLDGRDDARLAPLLGDHGAKVIQQARQAVHGDRQEDEVVLVDDLLEIARRRHLGRQPGHVGHPAIEARQVRGQVRRVEMLRVDGAAHLGVVIVHRHAPAVAAVDVSQRRPESPRTDDGYFACVHQPHLLEEWIESIGSWNPPVKQKRRRAVRRKYSSAGNFMGFQMPRSSRPHRASRGLPVSTWTESP